MLRFRVSNPGLLVSFLLFAALVVAPVANAQHTWTGGGANAKFSTTANWSPASAPIDGDALIFPAGASRLNGNNDLSITVDTITFGDDAYVPVGNGFGVTNGIVFNNPTNAITAGFTGSTTTLVNPQTWTVGGQVTWSGALNLSGVGLTVAGGKNLTL